MPYYGRQSRPYNRGSGRSNRRKRHYEDYPFSCDTCYKGFDNEQSYNSHIESHIKCNYDGCSFAAVEARLEKHKWTHEMINRSSDSAKYLEMRKRRFPGNREKQEAETATSSTSVVSQETTTKTNSQSSVDSSEQDESVTDKVRRLLENADSLQKLEFPETPAEKSLLAKLMNDEDKIRLLQCFQFIVDRNFFDS